MEDSAIWYIKIHGPRFLLPSNLKGNSKFKILLVKTLNKKQRKPNQPHATSIYDFLFRISVKICNHAFK